MCIINIEEEIICVITEPHCIYHVIKLQCNLLDELNPCVGNNHIIYQSRGSIHSQSPFDVILGFQIYQDS